jgi:hypothetical protein
METERLQQSIAGGNAIIAERRKAAIIHALRVFARQRSGIEWGNYGGDGSAYRSEVRSITKDYAQAKVLLRSVELRGISADDIVRASRDAYSGRLTMTERADGSIRIDYCTGQYFPTEYRRAVCAVLASALWAHVRDLCMPAPNGKVTVAHGKGPFRTESEHDSVDGLSPGAWLRRYFVCVFGRGIARRWFS